MRKILLLLVLLVGVYLAWHLMRPAVPATTAANIAPTALPGVVPAKIAQADAISGSSLNKAFPEASGTFKLTFTQEKDGFAQADLSSAGAKVAALTVSDTDANPPARDKFKSAVGKIGGYPMAAVGSQGTAVLVANRFQVQARSLAPSFTAADREAWLEKFKLDALAAIKK